jgi:hypothetical protein
MRKVAAFIIFAVTVSLAAQGPLLAQDNRLSPPCRQAFSLSVVRGTAEGKPGESGEEKKSKPPVTAHDITVQFLAGTLGGALSVIAAGLIIMPNLPQGDGMENIGIAMLGAVMAASAFPVGNSLGVYLAGSDEEVTGSYLLTLSGSLLGSLAAAGVMVELEMRPESYWAPVVLPSAGAIAGFNLSRSWRESAADGSTAAYLKCRHQPARCFYPGLNHDRRGRTLYLDIISVKF